MWCIGRKLKQRLKKEGSEVVTICHWLKLLFNMLGEKVTTEISKREEPNTFDKNKRVAKRGGGVAGKAR
jgi:hypothetical protein